MGAYCSRIAKRQGSNFMPKTINTRKQRAEELLKRLSTGPAFFNDSIGGPTTEESARKHYRLWAETWVIPLVKNLVPELRSAQAVSSIREET